MLCKMTLEKFHVQERDVYGALIESLGGVLSDAGHYDPQCTHLVVGQCHWKFITYNLPHL